MYRRSLSPTVNVCIYGTRAYSQYNISQIFMDGQSEGSKTTQPRREFDSKQTLSNTGVISTINLTFNLIKCALFFLARDSKQTRETRENKGLGFGCYSTYGTYIHTCLVYFYPDFYHWALGRLSMSINQQARSYVRMYVCTFILQASSLINE